MQDPCEPPPHHVHPVVHHHPPGQVIGRIRRHGTHRIAQRLHRLASGCPAGPPLVLGAATFKAVLPAVAFAGLTAIASSVPAPGEQSADQGLGALGEGAVGGGGTGSAGAVTHKHSHHPHPINVPEPSSLALLLLVTVGWMGIRFGLRRRRVSQVDLADHPATLSFRDASPIVRVGE